MHKGFAVFGGDWRLNNGTGGHSAFPSRHFPDENFIARHTAPGAVGMANTGVHTNESVFYITTDKATHLGACGPAGLQRGAARDQSPSLTPTHVPPPTPAAQTAATSSWAASLTAWTSSRRCPPPFA